MADLLSLRAKLFLDKSEYEQGLDEAERDASSAGGKLTRALGGVGKAVGTVGILEIELHLYHDLIGGIISAFISFLLEIYVTIIEGEGDIVSHLIIETYAGGMLGNIGIQ